MSLTRPPTDDHHRELLEEMRALRREHTAFRKLFDEFCRAFLNARFPYGKPDDRWRRSA